MPANLQESWDIYDSEQVIGNTAVVIDAGTMTASLLRNKDILSGFRKPSHFGTTLSDGRVVKRSRDAGKMVTDVTYANGDTGLEAFRSSDIAKAMRSGDIVVKDGKGEALKRAERRMDLALANDPQADE